MDEQMLYKDSRKTNYNGNLRDVSNICVPKTNDNKISNSDHVKYTHCNFNSISMCDSDIDHDKPENNPNLAAEISEKNLMAMDEKKKAQKIGTYIIEKTIGKGNFSVVKLATHTITQMKVAIKIIDKSRLNDENMKKMYREVDIMKQLNHPNIVKMYQVMETPKILYIVMEYIQNGEVFEHIANHGRFSEDEARRKFLQILSAVEHCHVNRVVHRDLKAENLLLDSQMNIKLADFGFGTFFTPSANGTGSTNLSTWCGSPPYAAPEIFKGEQYQGTKADIWSLGVVLYVLVCGALPFDEQTLPRLRDQVLAGRYRIPYWMSDACEELIRTMLNRYPAKRPTISKIKQHKWFTRSSSNQTNSQTIATNNNDQPHTIAGDQSNCNDINKSIEYNEVAISLMEKKGMKRQQIMESLEGKSYDHLTAFYLLLSERLKLHRPSVIQENITNQAGGDSQRVTYEQVMRRPSSVAEHVLLQCPHNPAAIINSTDQPHFHIGESLPSPREPASTHLREGANSSCSSSLSSNAAMQNLRQLSPHSVSCASTSNSPRPILGAGPPETSVSSFEERKSPPISLPATSTVVNYMSDTDSGSSPFHVKNSGSPETLQQVLKNLQIKELSRGAFSYPLGSEEASQVRPANLPPTAGNFHCNSIDEGVVADEAPSWSQFPYDVNMTSCHYPSRRHTIGAEEIGSVTQPYCSATPAYSGIFYNNYYPSYYLQRNSTCGHYSQHANRQNRVVSSARVHPELLVSNHPFVHQQHAVTSSPIVMQTQAAGPTRGISFDSAASVTSFDSGASANKVAPGSDNSNLKDLMVNIIPRSCYSPSSSPEPNSQSKMMKITTSEEDASSLSRQSATIGSGMTTSSSYGYGTLPLHHQIPLSMVNTQEPLQRLHSNSSDSSKAIRGALNSHQRSHYPQIVPPLPIQYNDGRRASESVERTKVKPASTSKALFGNAKVGGLGGGQLPHHQQHPPDSNYGYASVPFQKSLRDTGRTGGLLEIVTTRAASPLRTYPMEAAGEGIPTGQNSISRGFNTLYSSQRRATLGPTNSIPQSTGLQQYIHLQQQQTSGLSNSPRDDGHSATGMTTGSEHTAWTVPFDSSSAISDVSTLSNGSPISVSNNQHTLQLQNLAQVPLHYHSTTKRLSLPTNQPVIINHNPPGNVLSDVPPPTSNQSGGASPSLRLFSNTRVIRTGPSSHHSPCSRPPGPHYQRQHGHGIYRPLNTISNDNEQIMEEKILGPPLSGSQDQSPSEVSDNGVLLNQMTASSSVEPASNNNPLWPSSSYS